MPINRWGSSIRLPLLLAASFCLIAVPVSAQTKLAGSWHGAAPDGSPAALTLAGDGRYTLTVGKDEQSITDHGIWRRQGDRIELSPDPRDHRPIFSLASAGPWTPAAQAAASMLARRAEKARVGTICPWLNEPDVVATVPTTGAPRATAAEAKQSLGEAKSASDRAAAAGARAINERTRSTYTAAMTAMRDYRRAWGRTRDLYASAGIDLPSQPEPRVPAGCEPKSVTVASDLIGVHLLPDDARMSKLARRMAVGFDLPMGTAMVDLEGSNWAFRSRSGERFGALTIYYPAGRGSETISLSATEAQARVFTIDTDFDALLEPGFSGSLTIADDALILGGTTRFVRDIPARRYRLAGVDGVDSTLRLAEDGQFDLALRRGDRSIATHGQWKRRGKRIDLTADAVVDKPIATLAAASASNDDVTDAIDRRGDDDKPCQPGIAMAPPPGQAPPPACTATTPLSGRYVAVTLATPDGTILPDGVGVELNTSAGTGDLAPSRNGVAILPLAAGGKVNEIGLTFPDCHTATLAIPAPWRSARAFDVLLDADAFAATLPLPMLRVVGADLVPEGKEAGRFVPVE